MLHRFMVEPPIGTVIVIDGLQRFVLVSSEPYERKTDGAEARLLSWATECIECDAPFLAQSGLTIGSLNRRCQVHKRPGCRVNKDRPRGAPLEVEVVFPADPAQD